MARKTFIDYVKVYIKAGDGGDGCASFRREKFVPKGGPDGGDGGRGGDIIVVGSKDQFSLMDYKFKRHFRAKNGSDGRKRQQTGKDGASVMMPVPVGTVFRAVGSEEILAEVLHDAQEIVLQKGGKGGLGNQHFKTSTNQAPRKFTTGKGVEGIWIEMELKILADVGLVGFPNAGKSTLLSKLTKAHPKIGDYPFTTLSPTIGVSSTQDKKLIISDIPGLLQDAHQGFGLGIQFLKHIQRCKTLLFLLNADPEQEHNPKKQYDILRNELTQYDFTLTKKKQIIAVNKIDLIDPTIMEEIKTTFCKKNLPIIFISCFNGDGIEKLYQQIHQH